MNKQLDIEELALKIGEAIPEGTPMVEVINAVICLLAFTVNSLKPDKESFKDLFLELFEIHYSRMLDKEKSEQNNT